MLSVSTDGRRKASATSLREVGVAIFPLNWSNWRKILSNLVDTVGYSTQTCCLLQTLLKPLYRYYRMVEIYLGIVPCLKGWDQYFHFLQPVPEAQWLNLLSQEYLESFLHSKKIIFFNFRNFKINFGSSVLSTIYSPSSPGSATLHVNQRYFCACAYSHSNSQGSNLYSK